MLATSLILRSTVATISIVARISGSKRGNAFAMRGKTQGNENELITEWLDRTSFVSNVEPLTFHWSVGNIAAAIFLGPLLRPQSIVCNEERERQGDLISFSIRECITVDWIYIHLAGNHDKSLGNCDFRKKTLLWKVFLLKSVKLMCRNIRHYEKLITTRFGVILKCQWHDIFYSLTCSIAMLWGFVWTFFENESVSIEKLNKNLRPSQAQWRRGSTVFGGAKG